ncbi:hypothetical protein V0M98_37655 (plasmid) [Pseudomonas silesiensis]|uniref:hypothetical protein n=1 Tax=Pseudomonas silesiensis TaxID=1853130 RepID=UPI0030CDA48C
MRIPVSFKDFSDHFFSLVDALSGCWHRLDAPASVYQNGFAQILGYRDLQDLMDSRVEDVATVMDVSISMPQVREAIVWNGFTSGLMSYHEAEVVVNLIPLERLDWKSSIEQREKNLKSAPVAGSVFGMVRGRHVKVFRDEMWNFAYEDPWMDQTPELVEAGARPYDLSIGVDGRAFRWGRLRETVGKLPDKFEDKLNELVGYGELDAKARRLKFYREQLIEPLYESAIHVVTQQMLVPDGFRIVRCAGRDYLYNEPLGGYIPIAFHPDSGALNQAVLMILRGEAVAFESSRLSPADHEGFQQEIYAVPEHCIGEMTRQNRSLVFNSNIDSLRQTQSSRTFFEANQVYLRGQKWITPEQIPEGLADISKAKALPDLCLSQEVLPEAYTAFFDELCLELPATFRRSSERVHEAYRSGALIKLFNTLARFSAGDLDRFALRKFHSHHPSGFDEDGDKLPQSQDATAGEAMAHYEDLGRQILLALPTLGHLSTLTLGWLHYASYDACFGDEEPVRPFCSDDASACIFYLCHLLLVLGALAEGVDFSRVHKSFDDGDEFYPVAVLIAAIAKSKKSSPLTESEQLVLGSMNVYPLFKQMRDFRVKLKHKKEAMNKAIGWQQVDAVRWKIRAEGEFLYANGRVATTRQPTFTEKMMKDGRKYGLTTVTATQSLSDLSAGDNGSGDLAKLGGMVVQSIPTALQTV